MASRVFAVDLGAWSVKLAIASPGIRGATLLGLTLAASGLWLAFFSFPFLQRRRARRTAP